MVWVGPLSCVSFLVGQTGTCVLIDGARSHLSEGQCCVQ